MTPKNWRGFSEWSDVTLNQMKTGYVTKKGKSYVILALKPGQPDHTAEKAYYHHDSEELERFFRVVCGPLEWEQQ